VIEGQGRLEFLLSGVIVSNGLKGHSQGIMSHRVLRRMVQHATKPIGRLLAVAVLKLRQAQPVVSLPELIVHAHGALERSARAVYVASLQIELAEPSIGVRRPVSH